MGRRAGAAGLGGCYVQYLLCFPHVSMTSFPHGPGRSCGLVWLSVVQHHYTTTEFPVKSACDHFKMEACGWPVEPDGGELGQGHVRSSPFTSMDVGNP